MVLPFTLLLSQSAGLSRGTYVQSTKNTFFSSAADQMDGTRLDYTTAFNDTTMETTVSESGQTIPVMNIVDTNNSNAFTKIAALYYYTNTTDSTNSPAMSMAEYKTSDVIRMRCGNTAAYQDSSGQLWWGDQAYNNSQKTPGYAVTGTTSTTTTAITPSADQAIFKSYRESSTGLDYRFDVPNADYNVQFYFAEVSSVTTRLMDIVLEGTTVATAYTPSPTTAGYNKGAIQSFDVTVADGTLNININKNTGAGSTSYPRVSGIVVKKLQIEP
jgi:Malectin domain